VCASHVVDRSSCSNGSSEVLNNVQIAAAILAAASLHRRQLHLRAAQHAQVNGASVQKYRGTVGTVAKGGTISTRHARNYWCDDRLRYRSPPYFLAPVAASELVRSHEYVNGS
jgi:hypothetical protein